MTTPLTAPFMDRVLDDLVERMMGNEEYPKRPSRLQINLLDILCECNQEALAQAVVAHVADPLCYPALNQRIVRIVRNHLDLSAWVFQRARELAEEAKNGD